MTTLRVPAGDRELAADRLWSIGARAVEERDLDDGLVELRTALGDDLELTRRRLAGLPVGWLLGAVEVDPAPAETWRDFAEPISVNDRLTVSPAWWQLDVDGPDNVLVVSIEPGGAFGLGDHPTTRLSADAVDRLVRDGDRVLDVGCGSGVLAIVAVLRGASAVVATDIATEAVMSTRENARRNGVSDKIVATTDALSSVAGPFDLVVANILAPTLVDLAPELRRLTAVSGRLVLSGILDGSYDHVVEALAPMRLLEEVVLEGWAAIELGHATAGQSGELAPSTLGSAG